MQAGDRCEAHITSCKTVALQHVVQQAHSVGPMLVGGRRSHTNLAHPTCAFECAVESAT